MTSSVITRAEVLAGCYGRYLACYDDSVRVRVASYDDPDSDVFSDTPLATSDWRVTAALVILAWEASIDVVYAVQDQDRDVAWAVAKSTVGYTGLAMDFYQDGDGWIVVVLQPLAQC